MILADNETNVDLLNNETIARTITELLRERPERAITIGVHGDWGAGKSSILEMIDASLSQDTDVLCVKFNGWRFQGFEDAKIAFIEGIVTGLIAKKPLAENAGDAVKNIFKRIDWLKIARRVGGFAFTALSGVPSREYLGAIVGSAKKAMGEPGELLTRENHDAAIDVLSDLLKSDESKRLPEEIEEFRKAFRELLDKAGVDQLVVLIDDLDRCLPEIAIETLEAVRLFVFTERTAFVVAADEAMIEYSVRKHFPELPGTTGPRDYARNYLEKLIQVPFRIPALGETETRIYVTLLLVGAELGEEDSDYQKLIKVAREQLAKPWLSSKLPDATVREALGDQAFRVSNALTLSDQIGHILASGTHGNPRQIKRFLNALLLRNQMAHARGFGDDLKLPVLAKLMLAERFMSRMFDQVASATAKHADGHCEDLAAFENEVKSTPKRKRGGGPKVTTPDEAKARPKDTELKDNQVLAEWRGSEAIRDWANLPPKLGGVDLRPCLFVAKDRKDYFGAVSLLGRLGGVVDRLMGSKLSVQAYGTELRQLAPAEAGQVFEELKARIVASDSFDKPPSGVDGLTVLVKAHDFLQKDLLDLLESLPPERCGSWVASGWDMVIQGSEFVTRFDALLATWSKAGSETLKVTAGATVRIRKQRR